MNSTAQPTATTPLVLVVEDEPAIASILTAYLERDGLRSRMASDGQEALQLFRLLRPDLVLLDIHLPGMDGIDVLRAIRDDSQTPVIMVTALADDVDKLLALRLGADDYVVKPFSVREVVMRVRALGRRARELRQARESPRAGRVLRWRGLTVDLGRQQVYVDGAEVPLRPLEYKLLAVLLEHPEKIFSRGELLEEVWGIQGDVQTRTVDTHVRRLRERLGPYESAVETVLGMGYRLRTVGT